MWRRLLAKFVGSECSNAVDHQRVLFLLTHSYPGDRLRIVGVFSDAVLAVRAMKELKEKPGFRDYPDNFLLDALEVDEVVFANGFRVDSQANSD
jgi:hypothetical protein